MDSDGVQVTVIQIVINKGAYYIAYLHTSHFPRLANGSVDPWLCLRDFL